MSVIRTKRLYIYIKRCVRICEENLIIEMMLYLLIKFLLKITFKCIIFIIKTIIKNCIYIAFFVIIIVYADCLQHRSC